MQVPVGQRADVGEVLAPQLDLVAVLVLKPERAAHEQRPVGDERVALGIARDAELVERFSRSSGPGGQGVNTADSAVRIPHLPSGIVVACQNERSQLRNRDTAMRILKSRLFQIYEQKQKQELADLTGEKKEIAFGSQIRSYVLHPYQMVKDLRTEHETGNTQAVLDGDVQGRPAGGRDRPTAAQRPDQAFMNLRD